MSDKHSIPELSALVNSPYVFLDLGSVNDHVVSVMRIQGSYPSHSHTKDEMYIVLDGEMSIHYKVGAPLTLQKGDSTVVKAYTKHNTASENGAMVLIIKSKDYSVSPSE